MKVKKVSNSSSEYPGQLLTASSPPKELYVLGDIEKLTHTRCVGVVGSRAVTTYGRQVTAKLAGDCASRGIGVISGLALGVDAIAHTACLDAGGYTIAVLHAGSTKYTQPPTATLLVATDQPYQTHEHGAFHIFGAMGMVDEYLETNQEFIRSVLARREAELELPAILGLTDTRCDFLRPAHHLARAFGLALDASTGTTGGSILLPHERGSYVRLQRSHQLLYELQDALLFNKIPYRYREMPYPDIIQRYISLTYTRYDQLEAHAEKLVA